ncbi:hypothetical protein PoB_006310500 [Plakobranchus ocellatus]|uniref:Uncharacterized protein n=1 Tax=Plakobranchus ocellatus TaxID=259542 RepID=A0AAV4CXT2_9GAST|nr:hypothetical protein PoB_006310500 [Plakobranchus ocellatus]
MYGADHFVRHSGLAAKGAVNSRMGRITLSGTADSQQREPPHTDSNWGNRLVVQVPTTSNVLRGSVHPLQDVALRITSPFVSVSRVSAPRISLRLHNVVSPSPCLSSS